MTEYPIPVDRLTAKTATRIVCERCGAEAEADPDLQNDGDYPCPVECGGVLSATFKYAEGDRCPNCNRLGFDTLDVDGCCSRVCALQHQYATQLAAR